MKSDLAAEATAAAAKIAPPLTVAGSVVGGAIDPQWFVVIPTAVYVIAQLAYLLWKWRREAKAKHGRAAE